MQLENKIEVNRELIKQANNLAEITREEFNVGYDLSGIKTIEEKVNNERTFYENQTEKEKRRQSYKIGSYIGVCMIKNYNGTWEESENGLGIKINNNVAFPFQKVFKFLSEDGIFDSISSFYEISGSLDKILEKNESNLESGKIKVIKASKITKSKK